MPFRATFACLWCGATHTTRGPDDLEGWAQLCPDCVGKAGDNGFLRFRLHQAITERGAAARGASRQPEPEPVPGAPAPDLDREMVAYYGARAPEYDDWYLRRGRYSHGPIHDAAWDAELDIAGRWLDGLPLEGEIVELAAGTGWWSPLLASKGVLSMYDANDGAARASARPAARPWVAGAPPCPRRVGGAGPAGRCPVRRLLAEPRADASGCPTSWPWPAAG